MELVEGQSGSNSRALVEAHGDTSTEMRYCSAQGQRLSIVTDSMGVQYLDHSLTGERVPLDAATTWSLLFHQGWGYLTGAGVF